MSTLHDYTHRCEGEDYVLERASQEMGSKFYYMTGSGQGLKPSDYILLSRHSRTIQYRIEKIEYYCSPDDMWIALLTEWS